MNEKEIQKIKEFLYPSSNNFILNEINNDLKKIVTIEICISDENMNKKTRKRNYGKVYLQICGYLHQNMKIYERLDYLYSDYEEEFLVHELMVNFVFCLTQENEKFRNIHIFKNEKSICFSEFYMIFDL